MTFLENAMQIAISEAKQSLREGNHGFGAVLIRNNEVIAKAHDEEETRKDCTCHAEVNVIRLASSIIGKDLHGYTIVSTHEPCPMCASAIVWSGINKIAYGYSIEESIKQGRKRMALKCQDVFRSSDKDIQIEKGILVDECKVLYLINVRSEVKRLRNCTMELLKSYNDELRSKRIEWYNENAKDFSFIGNDKIYSAYRLLLCRFGIGQEEAPVIEKSDREVVFHSKNFCPTLEACKILGLDTRYICKHYNEESTDSLVKQVDENLAFQRNYERIRPYSEYCEERIVKIN